MGRTLPVHADLHCGAAFVFELAHFMAKLLGALRPDAEATRGEGRRGGLRSKLPQTDFTALLGPDNVKGDQCAKAALSGTEGAFF